MKEEVIQALKNYFEGETTVAFAFLFGSQAKGVARTSSDFDIGVYLDPASDQIEQKLWSDVERICKTSVDLVVLNRAPAHIAWSIVRGESLTIKDRKVFLRFLLQTSHEANDWYQTSADYHRVFERSHSLSREDQGRLERAVQFLGVELSDFSKFRTLTWDVYANDRSKKREVERWAEQLMNAVIDTAEIVLASEKRVIPETYKEIVKTLGLVPPFGRGDICEKLSIWTGLRNALAHEYLDYRWDRLTPFIQETEPLLRDFVSLLREFLASPEHTGKSGS